MDRLYVVLFIMLTVAAMCAVTRATASYRQRWLIRTVVLLCFALEVIVALPSIGWPATALSSIAGVLMLSLVWPATRPPAPAREPATPMKPVREYLAPPATKKENAAALLTSIQANAQLIRNLRHRRS